MTKVDVIIEKVTEMLEKLLIDESFQILDEISDEKKRLILENFVLKLFEHKVSSLDFTLSFNKILSKNFDDIIWKSGGISVNTLIEEFIKDKF